MTIQARMLPALAALVLPGCHVTPSPLHEAMRAGWCDDDADNDGDALFDCDDPDCQGTDICDGDADTDADTDTDADADTDTGDPGPTVLILAAWHEVLEHDDHWDYYAELSGQADLVTLDFYQDWAGEYREYHELGRAEHDPHGAWENWAMTLLVVEPPEEHVCGETTNISCCSMNWDSMTWMVSALLGDEVGDCVVWGHEPAVYAEYGCREI